MIEPRFRLAAGTALALGFAACAATGPREPTRRQTPQAAETTPQPLPPSTPPVPPPPPPSSTPALARPAAPEAAAARAPRLVCRSSGSPTEKRLWSNEADVARFTAHLGLHGSPMTPKDVSARYSLAVGHRSQLPELGETEWLKHPNVAVTLRYRLPFDLDARVSRASWRLGQLFGIARRYPENNYAVTHAVNFGLSEYETEDDRHDFVPILDASTGGVRSLLIRYRMYLTVLSPSSAAVRFHELHDHFMDRYSSAVQHRGRLMAAVSSIGDVKICELGPRECAKRHVVDLPREESAVLAASRHGLSFVAGGLREAPARVTALEGSPAPIPDFRNALPGNHADCAPRETDHHAVVRAEQWWDVSVDGRPMAGEQRALVRLRPGSVCIDGIEAENLGSVDYRGARTVMAAWKPKPRALVVGLGAGIETRQALDCEIHGAL